jgi:alkaline phosphatase D
MKNLWVIFYIFFISFGALAQQSLLQSGPMVGYSEMMEVMLWVQTNAPATVKIAYWEKDKPEVVKYTTTIKTSADKAFTAKLLADQVEPSKQYSYQVYINDQPLTFDYPTTFQTQVLWNWRTDPPNFKVALGSCTYVGEEQYDRPGNSYGGDYHIFTNIHQQRPDVMLWLGDNTYFREVDWYSQTGMFHRYTHTRSLPEMQPLLASTHHYAIWDDHDFGPNDSDRSFVHKGKAKKTFEYFWANPIYGIPQAPEGITSHFQWSDVEFFLLDNRYYRSPNDCKHCEATILGKPQLEWLIEALIFSKATFKVIAIGGQVLSDAAVYENYAYHHAAEREYLLRRIEEEQLRNVIFVDGDRHHTELSKITNKNGYTIYDFTVSPLTSGAAGSDAEVNNNRVEGTFVKQRRNFGVMEFSGTKAERSLKLSVFDSNGQEIWTQTIKAEEKKM